MRAAVETVDGVFVVDLEEETVLDFDPGAQLATPARVAVPFARVVAAAASGSTRIAVVDRRPPLVVSYDAGVTWTETGGGLPLGRSVAIDGENPDVILFAGRNRLYLSSDGGRFWRALAPELPEIRGVELG